MRGTSKMTYWGLNLFSYQGKKLNKVRKKDKRNNDFENIGYQIKGTKILRSGKQIRYFLFLLPFTAFSVQV
jgi:hypothetical protein